MRKLRFIAAATAAVSLVGVAAPAGADHHVEVVLDGLQGPFGLDFITDTSSFVVADSFGGTIVYKDTWMGEERVLEEGLPSPASVDAAFGRLYIATAGPEGPDADPLAGKVLLGHRTLGVRPLADLFEYELANNPDGQVQFVDGEPVDALSNPFDLQVSPDKKRVIVADAGANAVLSVHRTTGEVSTLFVPPTVDIPACEGVQSNPGTTGCDPVPTGVAFAPDGSIWVSTLGSDVPGAAAAYRIDANTGEVLDSVTGLSFATGIAVGDDGAVYVSELFHGAPATEEPPPGFDPSTIGRIVRIAPDGSRSAAQVTMPTGLATYQGRLYASAWSVAPFFGLEGAGQVVRVNPSAFQPIDG